MSRASTTGTIVVTFHQPILATKISAQSVVLTIKGQTATINRAATISGNTLTVDPSQVRNVGTTYRLGLNGTAAGSTNVLRNAEGLHPANTSLRFDHGRL